MPATPDASDRRNRGRRQLLLLAALFFVPLLIAFGLYFGAGGWRPAGGTNQGDLVEPARALPGVSLVRPDGTRTPPGFLRGKWTIVYIGEGLCDARCRNALYLSRQSRIALNKDMDRVQRVLLATGACCDHAFLAAEHPDLVVALLGDEPESRALLSGLPGFDGAPPVTAGRTYLVDPLGNVVLSYAPGAPDDALLVDLRKLLRLSRIG